MEDIYTYIQNRKALLTRQGKLSELKEIIKFEQAYILIEMDFDESGRNRIN